MMASCALCSESLDADDTTIYHEVKSWVTGPKLDGPVLRERTGSLAHKSCIANLMHGQAPDQPVLFEDEEELCTAQTLKGLCCWKLTPQGDCLNGENHGNHGL